MSPFTLIFARFVAVALGVAAIMIAILAGRISGGPATPDRDASVGMTFCIALLAMCAALTLMALS